MKLDLITNKAERQGEVNPNDEFYTPNYAIEPLLKYLKPSSFIWCPFDTHESNFVKMLINAGHNVHWTHIEAGMDFFTEEPPKGIDYIISNPPYSCKAQVFKKLFDTGKPFAMLIGIEGIFGSKERFELFKSNEIEIMYFDTRVKYMNSYDIEGTNTNPPYTSAYMCSKLLPKQIVFEALAKKEKKKITTANAQSENGCSACV